MTQKAKIVWIIFILWALTGIFLLASAILDVTYSLDQLNFFTDDTAKNLIMSQMVSSTILSAVIIVLAFVFSFGAYTAKKWTWLGSLMVSFYVFFSNLGSTLNYIRSLVYSSLDTSTETSKFILSIVLLLISIGIMYLYLKPEVRQYFK